MQPFSLRVHGMMLADQHRNSRFREAIEAVVRPGDVVTDVGAGTGLLSMFAARAGARKVYALESGMIAFIARRIIALNGMSDVIEVVQTSSLAFEPPEPSDVVISETLGYAVLDERFRPTVVDARERMLRPGGTLIPAAVNIYAVPVDFGELPEQSGQLDQIEGLDFRPLAELFARLPERRYISASSYLARPQRVARLDCNSMSRAGPIDAKLKFRAGRAARLTGFAVWFDALLSEGVILSSHSDSVSNHWGQAFLPMRPPRRVVEGEQVHLQLSLDDENGRFVISWNCKSYDAASLGRGRARASKDTVRC
jgi:precorrin-6B methylase 2